VKYKFQNKTTKITYLSVRHCNAHKEIKLKIHMWSFLSKAGKENTIHLIPWSRVLFEKLIVFQSPKNLPNFLWKLGVHYRPHKCHVMEPNPENHTLYLQGSEILFPPLNAVHILGVAFLSLYQTYISKSATKYNFLRIYKNSVRENPVA
jgi:hypothetical protein